MCGRITLRTPTGVLLQQFAAEALTQFTSAPRYNIAPTQSLFAVRQEGDKRVLSEYHWGLIPSWAKDPKIASSLINARSETVAEKPAFRSAFKYKRCLIPVDGYYEWLKVGKIKQPYLYEIDGGKPFAFAGLWERWQGLESCAVLTTTANDLAAKVHNRMPVILDPVDYEAWLDPVQPREELERLLVPREPEGMSARMVSTFVNNARNSGPQCIEPVENEQPRNSE